VSTDSDARQAPTTPDPTNRHPADTRRGLSLASAYTPQDRKAQERIVQRHACAACGKPGNYITGDRGPRRTLGAIVYFRVALKCRCGFLNFVNVVVNDLPEERRKVTMGAHAALEAARRAGELPDPTTEELLVRTAAAGAREDLEEALRLARETVEYAPDHPAAWFNLGWVRVATEDYDGGLDAYAHTLELSDEFPSARLNQANVYRHLEQYAEAVAGYDRFLERFPDHAHARAAREDCLRAMGEPDFSGEAS
jgi:tetratricopeptide (TPR) repeat protein